MRLQNVEFLGEVSTALLEGLARQPELEVLTLNSLNLESLAELADARALRKLVLYERRAPSTLLLDDLRPLAACRSLKEVVIGGTTELEEADVAAALGNEIEVTLRPFGR